MDNTVWDKDGCENWYNNQLEVEIIKGIRSLEMEGSKNFELCKIDYDLDKQILDINIKVSRKVYKLLNDGLGNGLGSKQMRLQLRKEVLDHFSSMILAKPMNCTLYVKAFLKKKIILYSGEIHNTSFKYARLE